MVNISDIKDTERRLVEAMAEGQWADYSANDPLLNDPVKGVTWGEERTVRAHIIVALCARLVPSWTIHAKGVRIKGAKITGQLDFQNLTLLSALRLENCWIESEILLHDAQTKTIALSGSRVCGIIANRISTTGSLYFDKGFICSGGIQLIDAQVTGSMYADTATFENPHELAFDGARLKLGGSLFLRDGFRSRGEIKLVDAEIGGSLVFDSGARLVNPSGRTLNAARLVTKGSIFLQNDFNSVGEILLMNAQVGGNFICQKATLENIYRIALKADGISVKGATQLSNGFNAKGGVRLAFSNFGATFECFNATFENIGRECLTANEITTGGSVFFRPNLKTSGKVILIGANIGGSLLCGNAACISPKGVAFDATRASVKHYLSMGSGFIAEGEVRLVGTDVGGLEIIDTYIINQDGIALRARGLITKGNIILHGNFVGEVNLQGVKTEATLNVNGSRFYNDRKMSVDADGLITGGDVSMQGIRTSGELRLRNAEIGGDLAFSSAVLTGGDSGKAIRAAGLKAKGSVYFDKGFETIEGGISLSRARIGGKLDCNNVIFSSKNRKAFSAPGMEVQGPFVWQEFLAQPEGVVNLAGAKVGQLNDDVKSWPQKNHLIIDGFKYNTFDTPIVDTKKRLEWIRLQKGFSPYAYEQAAQALRSMGREKEARKIAKAKQDDLRRLGTLNPFGWLWNWFLGFTIGHGYQVWRALLISIVVIAIGIGIFEWAFQSQVMVLVKDKDKQTYVKGMRCPPDVPCFEPVIYSIDTFLPIVDLRQDSYWLPVGRGSNFKFFKIYLWLHIFLGWMLTTVGVVGLTGLVRKE